MFRKRPVAPPEPTVVLHPFALLAEPTLGAAPVSLAVSGERIVPLRLQTGFFAISYGDERIGYLPAAVCAPLAVGAPDSLPPLEIAQPIMLYRAPLPGAQYVSDPGDERQPWLLPAGEQILLLGQDDRFVLMQRADGTVGYIPAAVCGNSAHLKSYGLLNSVNLSCLVGGAFWSLLNWMSLNSMLTAQVWADAVPRVYLGLVISLVLALVLWLRGSPYILARSFAVGVLAGYWLAHVFSDGRMIL